MFRIRLARAAEKPQLEGLIARSGVGLSAGFYSDQQAAAITREVFGVDSTLIEDRTYFAIEDDGVLVACGGWSRRATDFGGDGAKHGSGRPLDPATEAARIRAFFVEPGMERRGLGSIMLLHCMEEAVHAGFSALELVATLPGEPLYAAHGFEAVEPITLPLSNGVSVRLTRMRRDIARRRA